MRNFAVQPGGPLTREKEIDRPSLIVIRTHSKSLPHLRPLCYERQVDPNRQPFKTLDGYISIVPYTDPSLCRLFEVLGKPEILNREEFSTPQLRRGSMSQIFEIIGSITEERTTADWMQDLVEAQIPAMPLRDIQDILNDPHLKATGFFKRRLHPTEGHYFEMQPPIKFGAMPTLELRPAPLVGEHNEELA